MSINDFALLVCKDEGMKKEVNIAQVKEVLKVINKILNGALYRTIRGVEKKGS